MIFFFRDGFLSKLFKKKNLQHGLLYLLTLLLLPDFFYIFPSFPSELSVDIPPEVFSEKKNFPSFSSNYFYVTPKILVGIQDFEWNIN